MAKFVLPGGADRTCVLGMTGTGKTVFGAWLLSMQRFSERPWVCLDFKREVLWDKVGEPPFKVIGFNTVPKKPGLYRLDVLPVRDDDALEDWLWRVWERGNIGLFADEFSLVPQRGAMKACLRQGRSKRIPIIACTQRPVDCDREVFSESNYIAAFAIEDDRDIKTVKGFMRNTPIETPLAPHNCYWYDRGARHLFHLTPCPPPDKVAETLRNVAPYSYSFFG